jgi:predicted hydrocarbon binding protein
MFLSTFAFMEHRFGAQAREAVMRRLPADDRELLSGIVLPISWYPLAPFGRLLRVMDGELGRGDFTLVTERGEWTATRDLHTFRKAVLKFVSIPWVVNKGAGLWHQFHDTGRWQVRQVDGLYAIAELHDLGVVDEAICASIKGWILGLARLPGSSKVEAEHSACRARGDAMCAYDVRWT